MLPLNRHSREDGNPVVLTVMRGLDPRIHLSQVDAVINEFDPVVLTEDLAESSLKSGDVGCVVLVHGAGAGFEVEFVTLAGETVSVVTVPSRAVRPVGPNEIAHARMSVSARPISPIDL